uniref:Uncharacterized protein n=1 Tax=Anguilla anguilla TaxID=7936 RepID=A0A0E9P6Z4_ANGAN
MSTGLYTNMTAIFVTDENLIFVLHLS